MLTKIDELIRPDHYHLDANDECYFIGEYTAGRGFAHSSTNQFIYNLKKSAERRGLPDWVWKVRAIQKGASVLRDSLNPAFLAYSGAWRSRVRSRPVVMPLTMPIRNSI